MVCFLAAVYSYSATTCVGSKETIEVSAHTLDHYLCDKDYSIPSDTELLMAGQYALPAGPFCFNTANRSGIEIGPLSPADAAVVRCEGHRGIGFHNISGLTLRNIIFEGCGGAISDMLWESSEEVLVVGVDQQNVLFFSHCNNVTLTNIVIRNYTGYAIIASNLLGWSVFSNLHIIGSTYAENHTSVFDEAGSGLFLYYHDKPLQSTNTRNVLHITNSVFRDNSNIFPNDRFISEGGDAMNTPPNMQTGAGGITIHFDKRTFSNEILVKDTVLQNNFGMLAGGAAITYHNSLVAGFVNFSNCTFTENSVPMFGRGAGLRIIIRINQSLIIFSEPLQPEAPFEENLVAIEDSHFTNNSAHRGAGVNIFATAQNITEVRITLSRVTFSGNRAGDAGDSINAVSQPSTFFSQKILIVQLVDIIIREQERGLEISDKGIMNFVQIGYVLINGTEGIGCLFENMSKTAVYAFGTPVYLTGNIAFKRNSALNGGAIYLESGSRLIILEPAEVLFVENYGLLTGGAIASGLVGGSRCTIQYGSTTWPPSTITDPGDLNQLSINLTFIDNNSTTGRSINLPMLYNCKWSPLSIVQLQNKDIINVYRTLFHFPKIPEEQNELQEIRSNPARICICNSSGLPDCDLRESRSSLHPGQSLHVLIGLLDGAGQLVPGLLTTYIHVPDALYQRDVIDSESCQIVTYDFLAEENTTATVGFYIATDPDLVAMVDIQECPSGFKRDNKTGGCVCIDLYAELDITCDIQNLTINRQFQIWIGETTFHDPPVPAYAVRCPQEYCHPEEVREVNTTETDALCKGYRTGELCGKCAPHLSQQFGSLECSKCSHFSLFTILLYGLAGMFLVLVLYVLQLTIALGTINGLFFYAHLVNLTAPLHFDETGLRLLRIFIALLDLDLGFPMCFYDGMDSIAKFALQFVFPVYLWGIVIAVIFVSHHSTMVSNLTSHISLQVLVTLLYLSLSKVVTTILFILVPAHVVTEENTYRVWFFDGTIQYGTGNHIFLLVLALLFLFAFVVPYTVILTAYKCLIKQRTTNCLLPCIDAHFGPFKQECRIYMVARLYLTDLITVIYVPLAMGNPEGILLVQFILILLFLTIQAFIRPFKSDYINALDLFFMVNFCVLAATTAYFHSLLGRESAEIQADVRIFQSIAVGFLVGSVFLIFWGIIGFHINMVFRDRFVEWVRKKQKAKELTRPQENEPVRLTSQSQIEEERVPELTYTSYRVRESILDDSSWQFPTRIPHTVVRARTLED